MLLRSMTLAAAVALAVPAWAQDAQDEPPQAVATERQAVPRGTRSQGDNPQSGRSVIAPPKGFAPDESNRRWSQAACLPRTTIQHGRHIPRRLRSTQVRAANYHSLAIRNVSMRPSADALVES